jgi:hypothetical protein
MKNLNGFIGFLAFLLGVLCFGCADDVPEPLTRDELNLRSDGSQTAGRSGFLINPTAFDQEFAAPINPADFVSKIDNPFLPLTPGTTFIYRAETVDGIKRIEVNVTHDTKVILGVTCTVVRDRVFIDATLVEDAFDWYAQDTAGNVWYFGGAFEELENGKVVNTDGAWKAGINGAKPGIIMKGTPKVGDAYRQTFAKGIAEDIAQILSLTDSVRVPIGSFENCLKTMEWTPLEPDVVEHKFYAPGIGFILQVEVEAGAERAELVELRKE